MHQVPVPGVKGALWLCGKHAIAPDPRAMLERTESQHVVCLVERHELEVRYDTYISWLEAEVASGSATWFPIPDLSSPGIEHVLALYELVYQRLESGESVVAHCGAGIGRAGTLAVAVCLIDGMDLDRAVKHVRAHRPSAGPEAGSQRESLVELAARLHGPNEPGE